MSKYIVIDLETTGHAPELGDQMIEIGLVVIKNDTIVDTYSTFVNPGRKIPDFITHLTGISDDDVVDAPKFSEVAPDIVHYFKNGYLIAHNVPFDLGFLNEQLQQLNFNPLNNQVIDTVELSRILLPQAPGFKLNELAEFLDISHMQPHRALSDAYVTAKIFIKLKNKLANLPYETLKQLKKLEHNFSSHLSSLLSDMLANNAYKQYPDHLNVYQGLAVRQLTRRKQVKPTNRLPSFKRFLNQMYFDHDGLKKYLPNYVFRNEQKQMSQSVYHAFKEKQHMIIEAGTGSGKSIAYSLPAIFQALLDQEQIVLSTYTTQLQSQLYDETLGILKTIIDAPLQVALLKGKQHYLSLKRFSLSLEDEENNYDIALTKAILLIWVTETKTGDIEEIQLPASGYKFFQTVSAGAKREVRSNQDYEQFSYYLQAKERARQANIIIVNHALLCADIKSDYDILPAYNKAIIDEAHHFPTTFTKAFGCKVDYLGIFHFLTYLGESHAENKWINKFIKKYDVMFNVTDQLLNWDHLLEETIVEIDELFRRLHRFVKINSSSKHARNDIGRLQVRIKNKHLQSKSWILIKELANRCNMYLQRLIDVLSSLNDKRLDRIDIEDLLMHIEQLSRSRDYFNELFIQPNLTSAVIWFEIDQGSAENIVYLYSEPVTHSEILKEKFFDQKDSIILTSATLTVRQSFAYIKQELGLNDEMDRTAIIDSPFNFKQQVQLMIPKDFPQINDQTDEFIYATAEAIISLAEITSGRMLVLFTSYRMLRKTYHLVKETIDTSKYVMIAQGITSGSRSRLKKSFQNYDHALLFGTNSFWEGIDIPGEALKAVVIVRLPFQRPNEPVYEAKANELLLHKQNPFYELSLPKAVLRFKQGFGRLIRTVEDKGIVFVCDARIINKGYGHFFLKSIPDVLPIYDSTTRLLTLAENWLKD